MDTLTTAPVADVLARLFADAHAADGPLHAQWSEALGDNSEEIANSSPKRRPTTRVCTARTQTTT